MKTQKYFSAHSLTLSMQSARKYVHRLYRSLCSLWATLVQYTRKGYRKLHVFIVRQLPVVILLGGILALGGGCEVVSQSAPVKGGSYALAAPLTDFAETLAQGDNAETASRLKREVRGYDASGKLIALTRTSVELGTSRDPVITLKPAPAYGQYAVAVIGALAMIAGAVLAFKAWPKIGGTIAAGGFVVLVIGLTSGAYGWAWALLAASVCAGAAFALYSGYKSGLQVAS